LATTADINRRIVITGSGSTPAAFVKVKVDVLIAVVTAVHRLASSAAASHKIVDYPNSGIVRIR
jgi:hypothetical protein